MKTTDELWEKFSATMVLLQGTPPTKGDSHAEWQFKIWLMAYIIGLAEGEQKK